jgi:hypothetical protein
MASPASCGTFAIHVSAEIPGWLKACVTGPEQGDLYEFGIRSQSNKDEVAVKKDEYMKSLQGLK